MKVNVQFLSTGCRKNECPFWEERVTNCILTPYFLKLQEVDREHDCWDFEAVTNGSPEIRNKEGETLLTVLI